MITSNDMEQRDVGYVSSLYGGFWKFGIKDFCYMTNQYFPPDEFFESMGANLRVLTKSYPSTNWYLSSLMARSLGLTHDEVAVANGASELITVITNRFVESLAVPVPTFDEFINRADAQGRHVYPYQLDSEFQLDAEGFVQHVHDTHASTALFVRPNNPTGTLISKASLRNLLESLRHLRLIMVDDSFIDFANSEPTPSAMEMIWDFPNLVIIKSISKAYGIPGLRLGYAMSGNRDVTASLRQDVPIWGINSLAQFFLEEMETFRQEFKDSCQRTRRATEVLFKGLQTVSFLQPYPTQGNFVLCRILNGLSATELTARLFKEFRILINDCSRKRGLDSRFVRMASRTEQENRELVQVLRSLADAAPVGGDEDGKKAEK